MNDNKILEIYKILEDYHKKYLKKYNVKLPRLYFRGKYSKGALSLIYLARNYPKTHTVTKKELTDFIRNYYPDTNDVQQGRHLAAQQGWFIESGQRGDIDTKLKSGEYRLITLKCPYPNFRYYEDKNRNTDMEKVSKDEWENIKEKYNYRCATCGSKEGQPNLRYSNSITKLQKGHKDPNKSLTVNNIIPQCSECNRADKNNWIYNDKGRVIKISNPRVVLRSSKKVKKEIFGLLKRELDEK